MKKLLIILALMMPMFLNAQEKETKSNSKTLEFLAKDGSIFKKETYKLPSLGKGYDKITNEVLIITDLKTNEKRGCFRITTYYTSSTYSTDEYIGVLDPDELDAAIMSLEKILNDIIPNEAETYTEVTYKTRDGVQLGTFVNSTGKEWTIYVKTKSYTSRSMSTFKSDEITTLIDNLKKAKEMIAEKTK